MMIMITITMMLLPKSGWLPEGGVRAVSPDHHNNYPFRSHNNHSDVDDSIWWMLSISTCPDHSSPELQVILFIKYLTTDHCGDWWSGPTVTTST
jgi:hypothetical protein